MIGLASIITRRFPINQSSVLTSCIARSEAIVTNSSLSA